MHFEHPHFDDPVQVEEIYSESSTDEDFKRLGPTPITADARMADRLREPAQAIRTLYWPTRAERLREFVRGACFRRSKRRRSSRRARLHASAPSRCDVMSFASPAKRPSRSGP